VALSQLRSGLALSLACGLLLALASTALAVRGPTDAERSAIMQALPGIAPCMVAEDSIKISTVRSRWATFQPGYAVGQDPATCPNVPSGLLLLKRGSNAAWRLDAGIGDGLTPCSELPGAKVRRDLGIRCVRPKIVEDKCGGDYVIRPRRWQTGCGLCNTFYTRARWRSWGGRTASGTATRRAVVLAGSTDSCAEVYERAKSQRVRIRLSRPVWCKSGQYVYTVMRVMRHGKVVEVDRRSQACPF
jgi:hypothetical protein